MEMDGYFGEKFSRLGVAAGIGGKEKKMRYLFSCKCGKKIIITTKNAFKIPVLLLKRNWRIIDDTQSLYDRGNWRCPLCASEFDYANRFINKLKGVEE